MQLIVLIGALAVSLWSSVTVAFAQDRLRAPMTFRLLESAVSISIIRPPTIIAEGAIGPATPDEFTRFLASNRIVPYTTVYFNSRGGDLVAGLKLGEIIRSRKLNTDVGSRRPLRGLGRQAINEGNERAREAFRRPSPWDSRDAGYDLPEDALDKIAPFPGECGSSCTFAFLGGVERGLMQHSRYGVHQFYLTCKLPSGKHSIDPTASVDGLDNCPDHPEGIAAAQEMTAELLQYVQRMGADPNFLVEMVKAGPKDVQVLSHEVLTSHRVLYRPWSVNWQVDLEEGGRVLLRGDFQSVRERNRLEFLCSGPEDRRELAIRAYFDPSTAGADVLGRLADLSWKDVRFVTTDTMSGVYFDLPLLGGKPLRPQGNGPIVFEASIPRKGLTMPNGVEVLPPMEGYLKHRSYEFQLHAETQDDRVKLRMRGKSPDRQLFTRFVDGCR